jgi:hypothetical protein
MHAEMATAPPAGRLGTANSAAQFLARDTLRAGVERR